MTGTVTTTQQSRENKKEAFMFAQKGVSLFVVKEFRSLYHA
jgi:hypothetical protein